MVPASPVSRMDTDGLDVARAERGAAMQQPALDHRGVPDHRVAMPGEHVHPALGMLPVAVAEIARERGLEQPARGLEVGGRQHDVRSGSRAHVGGTVPLVELHVGRLDRELAAVRHGVTGVHREVHGDLLDLAWIDLHLAEPGCEQHGQLDILADESPEQALHSRQGVVQVDDPGLQDLLSAEREKLASQVDGAHARG